MYDHGNKKHPHSTTLTKSATREAERRSADRHSFTASAEVVELASGARFSTRTTDLGPGGCFVDTMVPFPVGAQVKVAVTKDQTQFDTCGTVVYSQHGLGMGIAFDALDASQRAALDDWLMELTGARKVAVREVAHAPQASHGAARYGTDSSAAVARLVRLMVGKRIITEAEGSSVLLDPVL
jgi:PilZ domain-containing protein